MIAGLLVVLALAATSLALSRVNLRDAEQERIAERARLTTSIGSYVTQAYAPDKMRAEVARAPFSPTNPALNELLLQQFRVAPSGDPNVVVSLFERSGRPIASRPEQHGLTVAMLGDAWSRALAGEVVETQTFRLDGEVLRAYVIPVGSGDPWAVLVMVPRDESGQQFQQRLKGLGVDGGGFSTIDATGIALTHWRPELIGTRQLGAADLEAIRRDGFRIWYSGTRDERTVSMAARNPGSGYAQVFSQKTADLFSDLHASQRTHDITTLAVVAVAVACLALLGWRREQATRRSRAKLQSLLSNTHDLLAVVDPDSVARFVSPTVQGLLGYSPREWTGRRLLDLVHPGDADRVAAMLADQVDARLLNIRLRAADGSFRWFDVESSDRSAVPQLGGILLTCHEVGERKDLQDRLSHQASHDELTGLANRAVFCERVEFEREQAERQPDRVFAVLFLDLDAFKPVNDTLGHDAGDQVLRTVAARLSGTVRGEDLVCRFGGDEFGILLPGADSALAQEIAARLVRSVRATITVGANLVHIDASIGITVAAGRSAAGPERLIREADEAMYAAKQAGRGRYAVHAGSTAVPTPRSGDESDLAGSDLVATAVPSTSRTGAFPRVVADPRPRTLRSRLQHLLPLVVAGALVVGIAGLGSVQETRAGNAAEAHRVAERRDVTLRVAEYSAVVTDPRRLMNAVSQAPWNLDRPEGNAAVLAAFSHSPAAGLNSIVALTDLSGGVTATFPADADVTLPGSDPAWSLARTGVPGFSNVYTADGTPRSWHVLPIVRDGGPQALLLLGQSNRDSEVSKLIQAVGSLGYGEGGLAGVDVNGTVNVAWDKSLIGTPMLRPDDLLGVEAGDTRRITRDGYTHFVAAAWQPGDPNRRYVVFRQPTSVVFADLRSGQGTRNLLLVGLVCASVLGLALLNRRSELSERRGRALLHALLHNAHDLVIAVGPTGRTTFVSSAIEGLLGHDVAVWEDRPLIDLVDPADRARVSEALRNARRHGGPAVTLSDVRLLTVEGSTRWFDLGIADLTANRNVAGGLLLTCHEIGERKRLQDELSHRARHDVLTGLPNRASFAQHLATVTGAGRAFAVLFIDLDHFKPVNDRYGHDAGDAVLQAVAGRLTAAVRSRGPRPHDLVSRLGGDEFAIVLDEVDDLEARTVADRILGAIRTPIAVGASEVTIGATIGIAFADAGAGGDPEARQPDLVVQRADSAMYEAKVAGRGRYAVFAG